MSFGNWSTIPPGAVRSTCSTPTPKRMVRSSVLTPQSLRSAGRNRKKNAAMIAPQMLKTPPIRTTASSVIEFAVGNCWVLTPPADAASRPPATPVMKEASAKAHSL